MGKDMDKMMNDLMSQLMELESQINSLVDKVEGLQTKCDSFHERILFLEKEHLSADDDE